MTTEEQLQKVINGTITDIQGKHDEPLCRVPNYTARIDKSSSWGSELTADQDGWLLIISDTGDSKGGLYLTINGTQYGPLVGTSGTIVTPIMVAIKKGDTYKLTGGMTSSTKQKCWFIPSINSP